VALCLRRLSFANQCLAVVGAVFGGGAAVGLLVVRSSDVLTLSLQRSSATAPDTAAVLRRHLVRLRPPMWVSIAVFAAIVTAAPPSIHTRDLSAWFQAVFEADSNGPASMRNRLLKQTQLNVVIRIMLVVLIASSWIVLLCSRRRDDGSAVHCWSA
jgi:hypothetical protein